MSDADVRRQALREAAAIATKWRERATVSMGRTNRNGTADCILAGVIDTATNIEHAIHALIDKKAPPNG